MIYLIGGPPKCGKTTLAKKMSKDLGIPWISSDTLQVIARESISKYLSNEELANTYPLNANKGGNNDETYSHKTPEEIASYYIEQAKATYEAIDTFCICEITDGNDYIIEGYHVTPELADLLTRKYGKDKIRVIFIVKKDIEKFVQDVTKSSTPNDWILTKTQNKETLNKIAEMISIYSEYFSKDAEKYGFEVMNMDNDFEEQIKKSIKFLTK